MDQKHILKMLARLVANRWPFEINLYGAVYHVHTDFVAIPKSLARLANADPDLREYLEMGAFDVNSEDHYVLAVSQTGDPQDKEFNQFLEFSAEAVSSVRWIQGTPDRLLNTSSKKNERRSPAVKKPRGKKTIP